MKRIGLTWILTVFSVAVFAIGLQRIEAFRFQHDGIMLALPLVLLGVMLDLRWPQYHLCSHDAVTRMQVSVSGKSTYLFAGPLVMILTWINHLLGASVGREGVSLQLGAWIDQMLAKMAPPNTSQSKLSARLAVATGFAVLFGAPVAGVVFVFESLHQSQSRERISLREGVVLALATFCGDVIGRWLGVQHGSYSLWGGLKWTSSSVPRFLLYTMALAVLSALAALFFAIVQRKIQILTASIFATEKFRGFFMLGLTLLVIGVVFEMLGGQSPYPGLGLSGMGGLAVFETSVFMHPLQQPLVLAFVKLLLTAFFVGLGLRGGEVTPLLVAGAALAVGGIHIAFPTAADAAELSHFALPLGVTLIWATAARRPFTGAVLAAEIFTSGFFDSGIGTVLRLLIVVLILAHMSAFVYELTIKKMRGILPNGFRASLYDE